MSQALEGEAVWATSGLNSIETVNLEILHSDEQQWINLFNVDRYKEALICAFFCGLYPESYRDTAMFLSLSVTCLSTGASGSPHHQNRKRQGSEVTVQAVAMWTEREKEISFQN